MQGYAFAQSTLASLLNVSPEAHEAAQAAVEQNERDGFFMLGKMTRFKNRNLSQAMFTRAADLGHVSSMVEIGLCFPASSLERWTWFVKAAHLGEVVF